MTKNHKIKKSVVKEKVIKKEEIKKIVGEEEGEKETSTLSDGVLDAFEEVSPVDPLLVEVEDETLLAEEEDDELDSRDYKSNDEW